MSFYSIKDREVRDRTIEDYLALKNKIQKRNEDDRIGDLNRYEDLEETYKPIVESHERMTRDLVEELRPISEKLAIKGELHAQIYPNFYELDRKSKVIRSEQKKPHQKILRFG